MESPRQDVLEEARRVVSVAREQGVALKLVGGIGVRFACPSAADPPLARTYKDVDLVGRASQTKELKKLFALLGYSPRETFNAMQGGRRMIFNDLVNNRRADIFLDYFDMCHKFDLRGRLGLREETLPVADLLDTKLQIIQANDKDYRDMIALLVDHPLAQEEGPDVIDSSYIVGMCADDWGVCKTFSTSLGRIVGALGNYQLSQEQRELADARARELLKRIQDAPKTLRWKLRARVGERVLWYESPEADAPVVDSRF